MAGARQTSSSGSQSRFRRKPPNTPGKKPLPPPTHLGHFIVSVVMKLCKKILLMDTSVKIGVYLVGVMVGSVVSDLVAIPRSYLSDKQNIFNQYFVKLGWGWTFSLLASFIGMTSYVYTAGNVKQLRTHLIRLGIATFWWYFCTSMFLYVESVVGICSRSEHKNRIACISGGKSWLGFDISGHVFLLIHNLLTISEEVKPFKDWSRIEKILEDEDQLDRRPLKEEDIAEMKSLYKKFTPYIKLNVMFLAMLTVLWEFMLITSTIYRFHTLSQKVTASFIAVGCWFISYRVLLRADVLPFLKKPGECQLKYMKVD